MERQELLGRVYNAHSQNVPTIVFSKLFLVALPIIQIAISAVYLKDCPQQPYIPVYMIVAGVFGLLLGLFSCLPFARPDENGGYFVLSCMCSVFTLFSIFLFCWLIAGSVWIYSIYPANYNKTGKHSGALYCNKTLYLAAFWTTTLVYILVIALIVGGLCVIIGTWCSKAGNTQRENA